MMMFYSSHIALHNPQIVIPLYAPVTLISNRIVLLMKIDIYLIKKLANLTISLISTCKIKIGYLTDVSLSDTAEHNKYIYI